MFSSVWNFVKRHRRKFVFAGVVVGGAYVALQYGRKKFKEMQDQEAADCLAFARKQHHFDSNQRTCNMTVLSMLPSLREALMQAIDTESLTAQLKSKPSNKVDIWEELKILSFTRTICAVYSIGMLVVVLRVQLNIIGGYIYVDKLTADDTDTKNKILATPQVQTKYLEGINYLLGQGLVGLITVVREAVTKSLEGKSLKEQVSLTDMQNIFTQVRQQVEYRQTSGYHDAPISSLCKYMLPEDVQPLGATSMTNEEIVVARLMRETRDLLESSDFQSVLTTCLDTAFTRLVDKTAEYYRPQPETDCARPLVNPNDVQMPLAKVIPVMNGLIHTVCGDAPNHFAQELLLKEQVKDFSANVYEAFSQPCSQQTLS